MVCPVVHSSQLVAVHGWMVLTQRVSRPLVCILSRWLHSRWLRYCVGCFLQWLSDFGSQIILISGIFTPPRVSLSLTYLSCGGCWGSFLKKEAFLIIQCLPLLAVTIVPLMQMMVYGCAQYSDVSFWQAQLPGFSSDQVAWAHFSTYTFILSLLRLLIPVNRSVYSLYMSLAAVWPSGSVLTTETVIVISPNFFKVA